MSQIWKTFRAWFQRLGGLFHKARHDAELAAELESHVQLHIDDNLRAGMTPEAARRDALLKLGGLEQTKERYRTRRGLPFLETILENHRFALRMVRRNPGFAAVADARSPEKMMEVLPAGVGRVLVRVTCTVWPSVTTRVGPGTCIVGQVGVVSAEMAAGRKLGAPLHP